MNHMAKRLRRILAQEGLTKTAAGKPYMPEVTRQKYREGEAFMAYYIDQAKNHSKFYEMAVVPDRMGTHTLKKLWGAMGQGRQQSKNQDGLDYDQALRLLAKHGQAKLRKGYKDAFKTQPVGQYPVGLDREVGFGWGTQEIVGCVPALRDMATLIDTALAEIRADDAPDLLLALEGMAGLLSDFPRSDMSKQVATRLRAPLARMKKNPRFIDDPSRTQKELKTLKNYIDRQTKECNI